MEPESMSFDEELKSIFRQLGASSNETLELLINRASCRNFKDKDIPEDVMESVLEAAIHAPSGGNLQPYSIIKIRDKKVRERLASLSGQDFVGNAPVDLIFCIDFNRLKRWAELETAPFSAHNSFRHFWISFLDTIIAAHSICIAADSVGLGSVYVGTVIDFFYELREMLEFPDQVFPIVLLCMGYPAVKPPVKKKLPLNILVHNEKYTNLRDQELLEAFSEKYSGASPLKPNPGRMKFIENVCAEVQGEDFAEKCIKEIEEKGYINNAQRYFALHYSANRMCQGNEELIKTMEDFGFGWFKNAEK